MPSYLEETLIRHFGVYRICRLGQDFCGFLARTASGFVLTLSAPKCSGADEANQEVIYGNLPGTQRFVKLLAVRFVVHSGCRCHSSCDDCRDTTLRSGK